MDYSEFNKFGKVINEHMPWNGEGETLNSQICTAVNKLCSSVSMDQFLDAMSFSQSRINMSPFAVCISHSFFEGNYGDETKYYSDEMNCYFEGKTISFKRSVDVKLVMVI